jgi:hypothetical protein
MSGGKIMYLSDEEIETLIAFIKTHERNEIPEDVWELCMKMYDALEDE